MQSKQLVDIPKAEKFKKLLLTIEVLRVSLSHMNNSNQVHIHNHVNILV